MRFLLLFPLQIYTLPYYFSDTHLYAQSQGMVLHIVVIWVMRPCSLVQCHSLEGHNIDIFTAEISSNLILGTTYQYIHNPYNHQI